MQFSTAPFAPRAYLPTTADLTDLKTLEFLYERLRKDLDGAQTVPELEAWLSHYGEAECAIDQARSERYIAMTCQTDDPEREAAYLAFVRDIEPKLKPIQNAIRSRYLDSPHRSGVP
ncbi:MAG TPA: hypothetical protein VIM58_10050, partial [Candidatus Methylacidiphilales bacterium]